MPYTANPVVYTGMGCMTVLACQVGREQVAAVDRLVQAEALALPVSWDYVAVCVCACVCVC